jgi:hypothetical protein
MIHHVSIPAREPRHVAVVLAELMGGQCYPFGPLEGAFMAMSGDTHGTMIEVVSPAMAREYEEFLKKSRLSVMNDPESLQRMRATHAKEAT